MVEGAALEMLCSQKEPRVRIPNSPPKSPVNKRVCRTFLFCSFAQNRLKTMERTVRFLERTRRFSAFWRIRTEKNQFFPSSAEISAHLLPKFTDSGSAIPLTIAFAEDSYGIRSSLLNPYLFASRTVQWNIRLVLENQTA